MNTLLLTTIICTRMLDGSLSCNQPLPEDSVCIEVQGVSGMVVWEPPRGFFHPPKGMKYA